MPVKAVILLIFFINIYLTFTFGDTFASSNNSLKHHLLLLISIVEIITILFVIKVYYDEPIVQLELAIKKVLSGKYKDEKVELMKSRNENLDFIMKFFSNTLNTLKNIKEEFIHGKEIKGEVELGKEIQGKSLNKNLIDVPELNIVAKTRPAGEIGGDSYDIIKSDDNYYIYVGDATGHGVGAGFIMMMVNALVSALSSMYTKGSDVLIGTNKILKPRVKANLLMTVLLLRWDYKEKRMFMTGAGHEYLMIYKNKTKTCHKIKSGGVALGMIKDISRLLKEKEIPFEKGDIIVLYSDGITEAINKPKRDGSEEMFGENRLMDAIEKAPNMKNKDYKSAVSVFNNITIAVSKFMGYKYVQLDDVTLSVVQYRPDDYDAEIEFNKEINPDFITEWDWESN